MTPREFRAGVFPGAQSMFPGAGSFTSRAQFWALAAQAACYDVKKLAECLQVNIRWLQRYFQEEMGRTPQDWLHEQRMIAARKLLLEARSIKLVAMSLRFKELSNFCHQFKKHYGVSPAGFLAEQSIREWHFVAPR